MVGIRSQPRFQRATYAGPSPLGLPIASYEELLLHRANELSFSQCVKTCVSRSLLAKAFLLHPHTSPERARRCVEHRHQHV
jgi:hypothetical protein